eukprot:TRINITY_DN11915_c0_g1_i1.p1 TRINITY_DN11915_c0_g1~~TRINITY_DN11915_c0_g1_i1.p1  ORF type:complete len:569 (+),score=67.32 TRINITY_DN11915_c0_g1_i1:56-1762(+)
MQYPDKKQLRDAVSELHSRGLIKAAQWAAEQLTQIPAAVDMDQDMQELNSNSDGYFVSSQMTDAEQEQYMLARCYFDTQEYRRAAHFLRDTAAPKPKFFKLYCLYMAGEKRRREEEVETSGQFGNQSCSNTQVEEILQEIEKLEYLQEDAFMLFLYGLALIRSNRKKEAAKQLLKSVSLFPCNWQAWLALKECYSNWSETLGVQFPDHWIRECFLVEAGTHFNETKETLSRLQQLDQLLPVNGFVQMVTAKVQYLLYNFDKTQDLLEDLFKRDPFRLNGAEIYSNVLWMQQQHVQLSALAQKAVKIDKFSTETCCIIGNYYALALQHEKAILYFRRAITLDKSNVEAWILLGHEYIEERNTEASMHAYHAALELQPYDSRCYYGLGYAYKLLNMPLAAIHYLKKASQISEENGMIWNQLGKCFQHEQIKDLKSAIICFRRAYEANTGGQAQIKMAALKSLAKSHELLDQKDHAAKYYEIMLEQLDAIPAVGGDTVDCLWFLAKYHKDAGNKQKASYYCVRLQDYGGPNRVRSRQMLEEIQKDEQNQDNVIAGRRTPTVTPPNRQLQFD